MILAEITAAVNAAGDLKTFYVSSGGYQTLPGDSPANINFISALSDPGSLGVNVYGNGRTSGFGALQLGQLQLVNADGRFDPWMTYGFDGRPVTLRLYKAGVAYASMPILFTGTIDGPPELDRLSLTLRLRDKALIFDVPACANLYGGTNTPPNGIDGLPGDLKGVRKAKAFGVARGVSPRCVNTSLLIYQVNDGAVADVPAVYDKALGLTKGADFATNAALQAATVSAGTYATCFAEGLFRLNATPAGAITADVTQGAAAANRTAAQIIKALAVSAGVDPTTGISAADVTALDAAQPAVCGIYIDDDTTVRDAISKIAQSIGAFVVFDPAGVLRVGRLTSPSGTPVLSLTESQGITINRLAQRDGDVPVWQITLNHTFNYTVQTGDIAGAVTADRRNFVGAQVRVATASDATVKLQYLLASAISIDSLLDDVTNAAGGVADLEVQRLLALYKIRRDMFEVTVHLDILSSSGIPRLMSLIQVQSSRLNLNAGKLFWLLGFRLDLKKSQAVLTVWG